MKKIILLCLLFSNTIIFAQDEFQSGKVILESGESKNVLIKNEDWKNNPLSIQYKNTNDGTLETFSINQIKEFSIDGESKFIKSKVKLDQSSDKTSELSFEKEPKYIEQEVLLRLLVAGNANLYIHESKGLRNYFYNVNNGTIEPLVYKKYRSANQPFTSRDILENKFFQQQLYNSLNCENKKIESFERVSYNERSLVNFFVDYNNCDGNSNEIYSDVFESKPFHLRIRPGINSSRADLTSDLGQTEFESNTSFRIGVEAEFILPFNNNKWRGFVEPTYQSYKAQSTYRDLNVNLNYTSIEIPLGIRRYFYLSDASQFFANIAYSVDIPINDSKFEMEVFSDMDVETYNGGVSFGGGYNYKKISAEVRYNPGRTLLNSGGGRDSNFKMLSFIIGYQIF